MRLQGDILVLEDEDYEFPCPDLVFSIKEFGHEARTAAYFAQLAGCEVIFQGGDSPDHTVNCGTLDEQRALIDPKPRPGDHIILFCDRCQSQRLVKRGTSAPTKAVKILHTCPYCIVDSSDSISQYVDARGRKC